MLLDPLGHIGTTTKAKVFERLKTFARNMRWSLHVPGDHSKSDVSYDELLGYLAAQGRDFTQDTKSLRAYVTQELLAAFDDFRRMPTRYEIANVVRLSVVAWIVKRMEREVRDVRIKANEANYAFWKRKHGLDSRAGIATGELLEAVKEDGIVGVQEQ